MNTDTPIKTASQDEFGYAPLAEHLTRTLILPSTSPSLIVGVESPWGAGKTSFLNLTREALQRSGSDVLIFEYRPWFYSTVDALVLGFCIQIAAQLQGRPEHKFQVASKALRGLGKIFAEIRQLPTEWAAAAAAAEAGSAALAAGSDAISSLHQIDLSNARDKVQTAISEAERPVVILVDDVDRLAPAEVRLLFQFIKAVADFRGVAYVLAYDPKPVENALSFNGVLDGREYLKKFVQLPIRLPRISNLFLQRFFRACVAKLSGATIQPELTQDEKAAVNSCIKTSVVLQALRTPRDVIRLLNSFSLRLQDCRGEVNLDQLLLFVLLDLVSPQAIELVRYNPELFLLPLAQHPEFEVFERESAISRLMSEEKDKARARQKLVDTLPEQEKEVAEKLVNCLFDRNEYRDDGYDVRRAQTAHGLIKLLFGGTSSLSFSANEAVAFLEGANNRSEVVDTMRAGGVLVQWIYFLSGVTGGDVKITDPAQIATLLIEASKDIPADSWDSVHRITADYLAELFEKTPASEDRLRLLRTVAQQRSDLFIAEHFLVKLASDVGLWNEGRSYPVEARQAKSKPDLVQPEEIINAEQLWLQNVRTAANEGTLVKQPHIGSILHRWGQFNNNDYTEVQQHFATYITKLDPLTLLQHFALGVSTDGLEKIVSDPGSTITALQRYDSHDQLRELAIKTMKQLQK